MRDYFLSDAEAGKTTTGWSSFELWKITIHKPPVSKRVRDDRPLWQILDEEEDRLWRKRLKITRTVKVLAWLLLSGSLLLLLR